MKIPLLTIAIIFSVRINLFPQDGLHLVGTITGTSETDMVFNSKGVGDVNGDGYADYIASFYLGDTLMAGFQYQIYSTKLYYGSSTFDTIPDYTISNSICYPLGDINNDGYDDIMAMEKNYSYYPPREIFKIYYGGIQIDTTIKFNYQPPYLWDMKFSDNIENIGDLNGDGYRDFIISSIYNWDDGRGRVYIFHGGQIIKEEPAQILSIKLKQMSTSFFGSSVIGIGDNNKDGYDDIIIAETALDGDSGNVQLYYGGEKLDSIPNKVLIQPGSSDFGSEVKNIGDINNDGNTDFIVTTGGIRKCYIYLTLDNFIEIYAYKWGDGGYIGVGGGGDINRDGYDDFILSNTNFKDSLGVMTGAIWGFWGNKEIDTIPDYKIIGTKKWFKFGKSIDIAGDINGDGYDDVLILEPSYPDYTSPWGKVYIYSYSKPTIVEENIEIGDYYLSQNYPNPFNPTTTIKYAIPHVETRHPAAGGSSLQNVTLKVYDVLGNEIITLVNKERTAGEYEVKFDGSKLSSGIYFYRLQTGSFSEARKMILMK